MIALYFTQTLGFLSHLFVNFTEDIYGRRQKFIQGSLNFWQYTVNRDDTRYLQQSPTDPGTDRV